ncbi:MAG: Fe-S cluster assembly protein SufD [Vampirovibrio sp.]
MSGFCTLTPPELELTPFEASLQKAGEILVNDSLLPLRQAAQARYNKLGFPQSRQLEAWKYVDLQGLSQHAWTPALQGGGKEDFIEWIYPKACRLAMVNGEMRDHGSCEKVQPLQETLLTHPESLVPVLGSIEEEDDALSLVNRIFAPEPYALRVPANQEMNTPLEWVIHHDKASNSFPALYIDLGENASAQVLIRIKGDLHPQGLTYLQGFIHITQAKGSRLQLTVLSNIAYAGYNFFNTQATLAEDAQLKLFSTALNAEHFRHHMAVTLAGEKADASLNGLSILSGHNKTHMHVRLTHAVPNCTSSQIFKAAVGGRAFHEFDGSIFVHRDAQKTNAQQLSRSLLLSKKAKAFARPWLQIDADDVKCSHGATVGQLDHAQLFYLLSRGISEERAKALLTQGFCDSMLSDTYLDAYVKRYFMKRVHCALVAATV